MGDDFGRMAKNAYALRELCAWVLQITSYFINDEIKFGGCFAYSPNSQIQVLAKFSRYTGL